jgi:hypothetical protein
VIRQDLPDPSSDFVRVGIRIESDLHAGRGVGIAGDVGTYDAGNGE